MPGSFAEQTIKDAVKFENSRVIAVQLCLGFHRLGLAFVLQNIHSTKRIKVS